MGEPFLGEVKLISWNFPPKGWAFCNGQLLPINQNQALFSVLGTTYGGNGQTNFALPDLRGRAAMHQGSGFIPGQIGGEEFHTLVLNEMPTHNHIVNASDTQGDKNTVQNNILAQEVGKPYGAFASTTTLAPSTISNNGGGQPHENRQPFLVVNFIIALQGIFPSQN
ncbi:phage tail protein [Bradyrhizobium sp. GCM10027634]|uniref:phage tail protein n=1 Tax=unclassified Bradyrhizobium TaxID=2631580 RepID=UPI00188A2335|nr:MULTISPECIES: tail fiber protein [unclassified Bradyrhizobium]MDN5000402.1 tail fiber protein [Bradyrhizobium sp. WYCCWR 12677]QOZ42841.1 phage tail protein [Bradyrhizobium sp. CCBAU 53340]